MLSSKYENTLFYSIYSRMPNGWIIALKKWNTGKQTWCLPKKGTDAYNEVMALMPGKNLKESAEPEKAAPPMKIPMERQRKPMSDKDAPKIKFVEPAKKAKKPDNPLQDYLLRMLKVYIVEEGMAKDLGSGKGNADEVVEKLLDKGKYREMEDEAIQRYGGNATVAKKAVLFLAKKGHSKESINSMMKELKDEGYTMFNKLIK